jgi:hypothetical protein
MIIDSLSIKRLQETQARLYSFLDTTSWISGDDIRQWISECVVHFTELNVPPNIIQFFLEKLDYTDIKNDGYLVGIGPSGAHGPFVYHAGFGYEISQENRLTGKTGGQTKMTPILVAFKVAENLINRQEDNLRLVPQSLIVELDRYSETKTISVSLSAILASYAERDTKQILAALISTTDSLLKLIPELSDKTELGPRIRKAYETKEIHEKYSISREVLWSLNNARIIRNIDTHNPNTNNETPIFEAVSYTHLLVLLILSILSSGEVVLTET